MAATTVRVLIARVIMVVLLVVQGGLLDAYLINGRSSSNYAWFVADGVNLLMWLVIISKPSLLTTLYHRWVQWLRKEHADHGHHKPKELRSMWLPWIIYSCGGLAPRIGIIYYCIAPDLTVADTLGTNLLKFALALTAALFLALGSAHFGPEPHTYEKHNLERVQAGVVLDIFDSGEFLDVFFTEERRDASGEEFVLSERLKIVIIIFAIVNVIAPTLALVEIEKQQEEAFKYNLGRHRWSNAKLLYLYVNTLLVNLPFLIVRIALWVRHDKEVSVLLVKNIIFIAMNLLDIVEYYCEDAPKRCRTCGLLYPHNRIAKHQEECTHRSLSMSGASRGGSTSAGGGNATVPDGSVDYVGGQHSAAERGESSDELVPVGGSAKRVHRNSGI